VVLGFGIWEENINGCFITKDLLPSLLSLMSFFLVAHMFMKKKKEDTSSLLDDGSLMGN
jgi:hypothetical protein